MLASFGQIELKNLEIRQYSLGCRLGRCFCLRQRSPPETQCQQLKELCLKNPSDGCAASSPFRGASQLLMKQKPLLKGCGLPVADVAARQQHRPRRQPRRWHAVGVTEGLIYKVANTIYFVLFLKLLTLTGDPHPATFSSNLPQNLTAQFWHSI